MEALCRHNVLGQKFALALYLLGKPFLDLGILYERFDGEDMFVGDVPDNGPRLLDEVVL